MSVTVEKGIPIPNFRTAPRQGKYPWRTMEVGDSFYVENTTSERFGPQAREAGIRTGRSFTIRKFENGVRVWRTA